MSKKSEYHSRYQELEIIGRGNFGSATLVKSKVDNNIYVAKKVLLGSLNPKEFDGAHLEVALLKELKHPHIVEYVDSFTEEGVLIIIMEYCEEGDLAYFVKKRAQKKEPLDEKLILNWFLQLLLALEFIHRKKILHRDIKSSNIFLRSNGTVKLGDFGISKVLENTNEAAVTVVGTPYYMSPEVCENKPYTFKSDVWALGCVIYEMCTLKHAFSADNLLGLVFKIVREKQEPIPSPYSKELSTIVQKLLIKNSKDRPSIREIFAENLIQKTIEEFIKTDGQYTTMTKIPVKKTNLHMTLKKMQTGELPEVQQQSSNDGMDETCVSIVNNKDSGTQNKNQAQQKQTIPDNETPQQKRARLKEEKIREEEEKMKNAAREAFAVKNQMKDRKTKELQGSFQTIQSNATVVSTKSINTQNSNQIQVQNLNNSPTKSKGSNYPDNAIQNLQNQNFSQISDISAFSTTNNQYRDMKNDFMDVTNESLSFSKTEESIQTQISNPTMKNQKYNSNPMQNDKSMYTIKTELEIGSTVNVSRNNMQKRNDYDDRPLPTLANKNSSSTNKMLNQNPITQTKQQVVDEYDEDFEEYFSDDEEDVGRLTMKASKDDIEDVISLYKEKLVEKGKKPELEEIKEASENWSETNSNASNSTKASVQEKPIVSKKTQLDNLKEQAKKSLGVNLFEKAYKFLKQQRDLEKPDHEIRAALTELVGKNNLVHCFTLDQIIFMESMG